MEEKKKYPQDSFEKAFKPLLKSVAFLEELPPKVYSFLVVGIPVILLGVGFFIWNIYLYSLGFIEDDILKARFILTGFFFFLSSAFIVFFLAVLISFLKLLEDIFIYLRRRYLGIKTRSFLISLRGVMRKSLKGKSPKIGLIICFLFFWLAIYSVYVFPAIPLEIGGGQPRPFFLVSTDPEKTIDVLGTFGITKPEDGKYQTSYVCVFYENEKGVYIAQPDRVMFLDKSFYQGLVSLPGANIEAQQACVNYVRQWVKNGDVASSRVLNANLINIILSALGFSGQLFLTTTHH